MKKYIFDACAIIAVLNKEAGAESVKELLEQSTDETTLYMSVFMPMSTTHRHNQIDRKRGDQNG